MNVQRGMRDKLDKYLDVQQAVTVLVQTLGNAVYDCACFGLDEADRLADERYMIFYNQPEAPEGAVTFQQKGPGTEFRVHLARLPEMIRKLAFTVSIDGAGTMRDIITHTLSLVQNDKTAVHLALRGEDFQQERAIISLELYKKDGLWRFAAVGCGFNGGLGDLLRAYGGEEQVAEVPTPQPTSPPTPPAPPKPAKVSLEKKLEQAGPGLVSLAKPITLELEKRQLLNCVAKVALVLDISGSMSERYKNGTVQEIVNKVLPLAVQFDSDGELDFWYYGTTPKRMPAVNLRNYQEAVPANWRQLMKEVGGRNNEALVMWDIIGAYRTSKMPAYGVFITDGGISRESEIKKLLIEASKYPVFWQFVGVGGSKYGILERLDTMTGRAVDNANFFALDDFRMVGNSELYSRLLHEFPLWLQTIRHKGIL